jgi:hypothetical protein
MSNLRKTLIGTAAIAVVWGGMAASAQAATTAVMLFIVDESGSMGGEHAWLGSMVSSLEADLVANGVTGNRYGLVGFGATSTHTVSNAMGHTHSVGGGDWGTSGDFATATGGLVASGGFEDGWQAIDFALSNYTFRSNAALNIVLVTDVDRDITSGSNYTYSSILADLASYNALLNVVVNCQLNNGTSIGVDSDGNRYVADGSGGYTTSTGGNQSGTCFGTTKANYVDMAWATGGASWDLNILRSGGNNAASFTEAFTDIKAQEVVDQEVPEPAALGLFGLGLAGLGVAARRRKTH